MRAGSKWIRVLVIMPLVLGSFLLSNVFAAEKIAFVDLGMVFDGYLKTKDYDTRLEDSKNKGQKDIDTKVSEIKGLQDKLSLLSDKEKEKKQEEITKKTKDLQEFQRTTETTLLKERDERLKEILDDIQKVVTELAKKEGYTLIVNDRVLLYGDPSMDISKKVLDQLNDNYSKKKK